MSDHAASRAPARQIPPPDRTHSKQRREIFYTTGGGSRRTGGGFQRGAAGRRSPRRLSLENNLRCRFVGSRRTGMPPANLARQDRGSGSSLRRNCPANPPFRVAPIREKSLPFSVEPLSFLQSILMPRRRDNARFLSRQVTPESLDQTELLRLRQRLDFDLRTHTDTVFDLFDKSRSVSAISRATWYGPKLSNKRATRGDMVAGGWS